MTYPCTIYPKDGGSFYLSLDSLDPKAFFEGNENLYEIRKIKHSDRYGELQVFLYVAEQGGLFKINRLFEDIKHGYAIPMS